MARIYRRKTKYLWPMGKVPFSGTDQQFDFAENASIYGSSAARIWAVNNGAHPAVTPTKEEARDAAFGDGAEFSSRVELTRRETGFTPQFRAHPEMLAFFLSKALGDVTTIGTGADYANRYQHTFRMQSGRALPLFHFVADDFRDTPTPRIWRNQAIESLRISGASPADSPILLDATLYGDGSTPVAGTITYGNPDRTRPFRMNCFNMLISGTPYESDYAANGTDYSPRVASWELEILNGKDETHRPGCDGVNSNSAEHTGERVVTLRINWHKDDSLDTVTEGFLYGDSYGLSAGTLLACQIELKTQDHAETTATSAKRTVIELPELIVVGTPTEGDDGTNLTWDAEFRATVNPELSGFDATRSPVNILVDGGHDAAFNADYPAV